MNTASHHDLLAWRLAAILQKLNQGEWVSVDGLAAEFEVHRRTIQRDLLERFAFLPLEKRDHRYALDPAYLGRITFRDIERFARLAGLADPSSATACRRCASSARRAGRTNWRPGCAPTCSAEPLFIPPR